ncbi:unnamed protein product [Acanthoscelides obtectus]|uniref:Uncharacterized protein n=1 Tax=Acanthoscelides obtectus TaxID=200917 RepID=A0A9P0LHF6_ACAOB|nr:unnamed protein product [Acanthoscelides obtectus]CAK1676964.1 hypothetical protein AOBTE_LOCUS31032 [Acanthoscelides obtectus]
MDTYSNGEPTGDIRYQSKISEAEAAYAVTLKNSIMDMKKYIATLKQKISEERMLLEKEKNELYGKYNRQICDCKEHWKNVKFTYLNEQEGDSGDETDEDAGPYVTNSGDRR